MTLTLCAALLAAYDRLAVAYVTRAAIDGRPEIARAIDLSELPSVSATMLAEIERQMQECPK